MINTVLQTIERFEASEDANPGFDLSAELQTSIVPTTIAFDNIESDDASFHIDYDEDTSEYSDDSKDILESDTGSYERLAGHADQDHIKQNLKDKIRLRRESEGAGELSNLFDPPIQYELTKEEEKKNEVRKQRNRRSANKSRLKRIAYEKKLEQDAGDLEKEHKKLLKEVEEMNKQKLVYYQVLKQHLQTSCQKVPEALKQTLTRNSTVNTDRSTAARPAVSMQNERVSSGTNPMSNNQLSISHRDSQPPQYSQLPPNFHLGMKRNTSNDEPMCSAKIPMLWNSQGTRDAAQTCTNTGYTDDFQRTATTSCQTVSCNIAGSVSGLTNIGNKDNSLCEIPVNCTHIQPPFTGSSPFRSPPVYNTIVSSSNNLAIKREMKVNVTEEQKINQIKEHLLDGFK